MTKHEDKLLEKEDEIRQMKDKHNKVEGELVELDKKFQTLHNEKNELIVQLRAETELSNEAEEARMRLIARKQELEEIIHELQARIEDEVMQNQKFNQEKKKLQSDFQDLEEQLEEEETSRQKLQIEKSALEVKIKKLQEDGAIIEDTNNKLTKEKKILDDRLAEVVKTISEEEEKAKHLAKLKVKNESTIAELEERLKKEQEVILFIFCYISKQCSLFYYFEFCFCFIPPILFKFAMNIFKLEFLLFDNRTIYSHHSVLCLANNISILSFDAKLCNDTNCYFCIVYL